MLDQVSQSNPSATELLYTYDTLLHGFAATLSRAEAEAMESMEGCLAVMPSSLNKISTTHTPEFLGLASSPEYYSPGLWSEYPAKGKDVIVGVIDTGIWPESQSFNDDELEPVDPLIWKGTCESGMCNNKIIGAQYFHRSYKQHFHAKLNDVSPRDTNLHGAHTASNEDSPRDNNGHGTHTASIAAGAAVTGSNFFGTFATGTARGMAPQARLAIYKACWEDGCDDADLTKAMEKAVDDGVHIISYSIGSADVPFYNNPAAIGAYGAIQKGVLFTASAGNRGPISTLSNTAPWVITVGASSIDRDFPASVVLGDGEIYKGTSTYATKPTLLPSLPLVYVSTNSNSRRCLGGSLDRKTVEGKIVLCDQLLVSENKGETTAFAKGEVVANAGGAGMILANEKLYGDDQFITHPSNLPAISVIFIDGEEIKEYISSDPNAATATMNITAETVLGESIAPTVAAFSSRGPSKGYPNVLKPDMIAPGVNILAAVKDDYMFMSGTSMACSHVSGTAALIKQIHSTWTPAAIKSALMTSSSIVDNTEQPITDSYIPDAADPFIRGAGHLNPRAAVDPGLVYDMEPQDYINFLCSLGYMEQQIGLLTHKKDSCPTSPLKPDDFNYPSFSVLFDPKSGNKPVQARRTVTYVGKTAPAAYRVSVESPLGVTITVNPDILIFQKLQDKATYTVTFHSGTASPSQKYAFGEITWKGIK